MDRDDIPGQLPTEDRSADVEDDVNELAEVSTDDGNDDPSEDARHNGKLNPSF